MNIISHVQKAYDYSNHNNITATVFLKYNMSTGERGLIYFGSCPRRHLGGGLKDLYLGAFLAFCDKQYLENFIVFAHNLSE